MLAHDSFADTFGIAAVGDLDSLAGLIRKAVRAGYAVVLNLPGTKQAAVCTLSDKAARDADRAIQEADLSAGVRNPRTRHLCGKHHALTLANTDDGTKVSALLSLVARRYGGVPNIGLEPGLSRVVIADLDTVEQRDAFLSAWRSEDPMGVVPDPAELYTVRSPGHQKNGVWEHKDGGHVWFTLPVGVELPLVDNGVYTDPDKWSLYWSGSQVLVPPSVRTEGAYVAVGAPWPAPDWILTRITSFVTEREARTLAQDAARRVRVESGEINGTDVAMSDENMPWAGILEPRGWAETGRRDACGCLTWTAPGSHASPKSATAHEIGCSHPNYDDDSGHRPIHLWSDTVLVGAPRTLTKLQFIAWWDHGGDVGAAVVALGLAVTDGGPMVIDNPFDLGPAVSPVQEPSTPSPQAVDNSNHEQVTTEDEPWDTPAAATYEQAEPPSPTTEKPRTGTLAVYDSADLDDLPDPDPLIYGLLDRGSVAILSGKFGTYKSFLALDWAAHVATGRSWEGHPVDGATPAVYIAAEGQVGVKRRVRGWRRRHLAGEHLPRGALTVIPQRVVLEMKQIKTGPDAGKWEATAHLKELVALVNERGAGLVVFDTLSKSKGNADENSNSEMSAIMALVIEVTRATGATVLLVAHTGYSGEHTRGGSSQEDDVDTVFVIQFEDPKNEDRSIEHKRILRHRKSKDGELTAPMVLVPRVDLLGEDSHGRPITTLTFTTDPFEEAPKPTTVGVEDVVAWLRNHKAPTDLSQRDKKDGTPGYKSWIRGHKEYARIRTNDATLSAAYSKYKAGDFDVSESPNPESPDDQHE